MVAVVDKKNKKKYKAIKVEEQEDVKSRKYNQSSISQVRVSVQGVKSLGGHFACLCRGFDFYEVKFIYSEKATKFCEIFT